MKTKPKKYKWTLGVPNEVYDFMISPKGVGSAKLLFGVGGKKFWHNPKERFCKFDYIGYYERRKDAIEVMAWLIDWYHAAAKRTDGKCMFPNWPLNCGLL